MEAKKLKKKDGNPTIIKRGRPPGSKSSSVEKKKTKVSSTTDLSKATPTAGTSMLKSHLEKPFS